MTWLDAATLTRAAASALLRALLAERDKAEAASELFEAEMRALASGLSVARRDRDDWRARAERAEAALRDVLAEYDLLSLAHDEPLAMTKAGVDARAVLTQRGEGEG